jgi:SAM-dependent methyltransferase
MSQERQFEWRDQWQRFRDDELFLFEEWIAPLTLDEFRGKTVLECGCGGGQHTSIVAPLATRVVAVDLNTAEIARSRNAAFANVQFIEADIATLDLGEQFDIVFCIGVIHHTDNPDRTFEAIYRHCKPGGRVLVWTYSSEGNALVRYAVEPVRRVFLRHLSRSSLAQISRYLTALLVPIVHTVYRLPFLNFLPYYQYFCNFRRLPFERNVLNVFDKLNAPQTIFTTLARCHGWFSPERFDQASISIRRYAGVSYALCGMKRTDAWP